MAWAEDVVQEVFVQVWKDREDWPPRSPKAYLHRLTRNRALDVIRKRRARRDREGHRARRDHEARRPATPAEALEGQTLRDVVDRAIQDLPERRREAFVLAYIKGLSYREIADVMEISTKTIGHHVSAALADLRTRLRPVFDEIEE